MVDGVSVPLALEDAVPVVLSTAGFLVLAHGIGSRVGASMGRVAASAGIVIGLGGVAKVAWKLVAAFGGVDVAWLDDLLFPLLAVGFAGFATALAIARRGRSDPRQVTTAFTAVALLVAAALLFDTPVGIRVARAVAIVGSLATSVLLVRIAAHAQRRLAAALLVANVSATLALAGMARIEEQTLALQWVEQGINTASQLAFLVAAVRLASAQVPWGVADEAVLPLGGGPVPYSEQRSA